MGSRMKASGGPPGSKGGPLVRRHSGVLGYFSRASVLFKRLRRYVTVRSLSVAVLVFGVCYYVVQQRLLSVSRISFGAEGPGLAPAFNIPSRFFSLSLQSDKGTVTEDEKQALSGNEFSVSWSTSPRLSGGAKVTTQVVNKQDGTFLLRYTLHDDIPAGYSLTGKLLYAGKKPEKSIVEPFVFKLDGPVHPATCQCPQPAHEWKQALACSHTLPRQLQRDLSRFPIIDLDRLRKDGPAFAAPNTLRTVIHYVIKNNQIFRRHFGPLPGFQYFMDNVLLYLAAAVKLPDVEFLMNLGDWPLEKRGADEGALPLFSWSGSDDTLDIILPQWDVVKTSTAFGKSDPDLLTVQAGSLVPLAKRIPKALFRGRDSNPVRVKLAELARAHSDLLDVAITSWENDTHAEQEKKLGGGYKARIPLEKFGEYRYQLLVDGTVAAFRTPYLLMTGSLPLKHESRYYEWFYADLEAGVHYLPFKSDLSDLVDQLKWAEQHPVEAQAIADRARQYAQEHLAPNKIFCYYFQALEAYAARQKGTPTVTEDMVKVQPTAAAPSCACESEDSESKEVDISYPLVQLNSKNIARLLGEERKVVVVASYSSFCNKSSSFLPKFLKAARAFAAKKAPVLFALAEGLTNRYPAPYDFCNYKSQPRVLVLPSGRETEKVEVMDDFLTVFNIVKFVSNHVAGEFRPSVPEDLPEVMSQAVPADNSKPVKVVVGNTFDSIVFDKEKDVLLEIYAPWCGHCKNLKPLYEEFARLASLSPTASKSLVVAKMDGTENTTRHKAFSWSSYPTILFVRAGSHTPIPFSGPRTIRGFYDFVVKHASHPIDIAGIPPPEVDVFSGPTAATVVNSSNFDAIVNGKKDVLLEVYAPWCGHCKRLQPEYELFAKAAVKSPTAQAHLVVAKMDGTETRLSNPDFKVTGFPTIWFIKKGSGKPIRHTGGRSARDLLKFVQEHATSKIDVELPPEEPPKPLSQAVPTDNSGPVKVIVRDTFEKQVLQSDKDVLLEVYAPWCGHCKKLEPVYEAFAREAAKSPSASKHLVVAKMDGTQNTLDNPDFKWTGFPTIWFIKKGSGKPIKHTGGRSARDLLKFVQEHATSKIDVELPPEEPPKPLSQAVPTDNSGPVKVIVRDTFEKQVLQSDK
ncbi:protein disulfide-isomerase domain-containing protein, partial [Toxoplasma gondii VEG]